MRDMQNENVRQRTAMDYKKRVCQAMDFISRNLDRDLSLEEVAQAASFSMFHFHRIFKAVVVETVAFQSSCRSHAIIRRIGKGCIRVQSGCPKGGVIGNA